MLQKISLFFCLVVVIYIGTPTCAQWTGWMQSTCLGNACTTGSMFRIRECQGGICPGNDFESMECLVPCPFNVTWSEYIYGDCRANPSRDCLTGDRVHTRSCQIAGPPYTKVPAENCPGGTAAATLIQDCTFSECAALTVSDVSNCSETCGNGYQIVTKTCNNSSPILPECLEILEYCNVSDCAVGADPVHWGRWGDFGNCSNPCSPGVRYRMRPCMFQNRTVVNNSMCTENSYFEYIPCNEQLCNSYTESAVVCDNVCNGSYFNLRSCQDSGYALPDCTKQPIETPCEDITDRESCGDPDIDLLLVLEPSIQVDNCSSKERELFQTGPFLTGNPLFSPANFPSFFRQKLFAVNFINEWKEVIDSDTRVGLKLAGKDSTSSCNTDNLHYLNDPGLRQMQVLQYPYTCDSPNIIDTAKCSIEQVFVADKGDRADKKNFIIMVTPNLSGIFLTITKQAFPMLISPLLGNNTHLFMISHLNPAEVTAEEWNNTANTLKQLACFSPVPVSECDLFLGSTWDPFEDILLRFREAVLSRL